MSHRRKKRKPNEPNYVPAYAAFVRDEEAEREAEEALQVYERLAGIRVPHPDLHKRLLQLVRAPAFADQICNDSYVRQEAQEAIIAVALKAVLLGGMFESQRDQIIEELKEVCSRRDTRLAAAKVASSVRAAPPPSRPKSPSTHRAPNPLLSRSFKREAAKQESKKSQFQSATCGYCRRVFVTPKDHPENYCCKKCEHLDRQDPMTFLGLPAPRSMVGWDWQKAPEGVVSEGAARQEAWSSRYVVSPKQKCEFCKESFFADRPQRFCSKDCAQAAAEEKRD